MSSVKERRRMWRRLASWTYENQQRTCSWEGAGDELFSTSLSNGIEHFTVVQEIFSVDEQYLFRQVRWLSNSRPFVRSTKQSQFALQIIISARLDGQSVLGAVEQFRREMRSNRSLSDVVCDVPSFSRSLRYFSSAFEAWSVLCIDLSWKREWITGHCQNLTRRLDKCVGKVL